MVERENPTHQGVRARWNRKRNTSCQQPLKGPGKMGEGEGLTLVCDQRRCPTQDWWAVPGKRGLGPNMRLLDCV